MRRPYRHVDPILVRGWRLSRAVMDSCLISVDSRRRVSLRGRRRANPPDHCLW